MTTAICGSFVIAAFLLTAWTVFGGLLDTTTDQTESLREANELYTEHLDTLIAINSTGTSGDGFTAAVDNRSKGVSFGDFFKMDVFARYVNVTGDPVAKYLAYPDDWSVSSISGDNTNPNVWDSGGEGDPFLHAIAGAAELHEGDGSDHSARRYL